MKNKSTTIILGILMIGAMIGGIFLARQNQNTQKGAYFAGTNLLMMPAEMTGATGNKVDAQLFVETDGAKLSSIDTQICYGNELVINAADPKSQIELNTAALGTLVSASVVGEGYKCLRLIAIADVNKAPADLASGMIRVATIHFDAVATGSGNLQIVRNETKVGGYNPTAGATDSALQINNLTDAAYTITGTSLSPTPTPERVDMCKSASISVVDPTTVVDNITMSSSVKDGMTADHFTYAVYNVGNTYGPNNPKPVCVTTGGDSTYAGDCPTGTHHLVFLDPNTAVRQSGTRAVSSAQLFVADANNGNKPLIHAQILAYFQLGSGTVSLPEPNCVVFTNAVASTVTPTPIIISNGLVLKFKMSFFGINNGAQCALAKDLPLSIIARASDGGSQEVVTNVLAVRETFTNANTLAIYDVTVPLKTLKANTDFALFIKGPKSLQVKYGVNNQAAYYNKAGGELSGLTNDESTTQLFDFTKYPLLAGDVTGATSEVQDGVVDGLDFYFVKTEAIKRTEVAAGGYMLADLNGNCKMESQDLAILMLSLKEKQAQLY